jgi:hypothetical protein
VGHVQARLCGSPLGVADANAGASYQLALCCHSGEAGISNYRARALVKFKRAQKIALVNRFNPTWTDLVNRKSDSSE